MAHVSALERAVLVVCAAEAALTLSTTSVMNLLVRFLAVVRVADAAMWLSGQLAYVLLIREGFDMALPTVHCKVVAEAHGDAHGVHVPMRASSPSLSLRHPAFLR